MKVTLHEVAARANVSIATVSRALNGRPVSEESKRRVDEAVAELGYVANDAARALRSDRTMTMGLIFHDVHNALAIQLLDGLSEAVEAAGYALLFCTARGDGRRYDVLMRRFLERRVDALFCVAPRGKGESLEGYSSGNIPVLAMLTASRAFSGLPVVVPAFDEPAEQLCKHLYALGHRQVALMRGATSVPPLRAIAHVLKKSGIRVDGEEVGGAGGARETLERVMSKKRRPTAIIAPDQVVRGLLAACEHARLRVPEDLSIVSVCDVAAETHNEKHGISSAVIDPHRMGRACGSAMLTWLSGARPAGRTRVQIAEFVPRASTGSPPR